MLFLIHINNAGSWLEMKRLYTASMATMSPSNALDEWCHPLWSSLRPQIANIISNETPINFLQNPFIQGTMVHQGYGAHQMYEERYLGTCISEQTKHILTQVSDTTFGDIPRTSAQFNCSTNTLVHLFYLAKILEASSDNGQVPVPIKTVVEFGGGYGNLTRLIKQALPDVTIVIIDLPEMCALQWFFLKSTLPDHSIIFHTDNTIHLIPHAIHLIPLNLLDTFSLKADLFVSTFALSECSQKLQEHIIQKKFFDASWCYITGQLEGWGNTHNFVNQSTLLSAIQLLYKDVLCEPFHVVMQNFKSYELIAHH